MKNNYSKILGLKDNSELSIIDMNGKLIKVFNPMALDISQWAPQLYFWRAIDNNGLTQSGKFVKQ
ncbi:MAG TPA: T9SS type A sorting domain-containing protein [Saprospiraceae bacterium]|nr:T9SS type A sorting domain-containing protein [Saprospiraceae bacterium]